MRELGFGLVIIIFILAICLAYQIFRNDSGGHKDFLQTQNNINTQLNSLQLEIKNLVSNMLSWTAKQIDTVKRLDKMDLSFIELHNYISQQLFSNDRNIKNLQLEIDLLKQRIKPQEKTAIDVFIHGDIIPVPSKALMKQRTAGAKRASGIPL